jgi:hypothetical protein
MITTEIEVVVTTVAKQHQSLKPPDCPPIHLYIHPPIQISTHPSTYPANQMPIHKV